MGSKQEDYMRLSCIDNSFLRWKFFRVILSDAQCIYHVTLCRVIDGYHEVLVKIQWKREDFKGRSRGGNSFLC